MVAGCVEVVIVAVILVLVLNVDKCVVPSMLSGWHPREVVISGLEKVEIDISEVV